MRRAVLALAAVVALALPASTSAAVFVSQPYDGQVFTSGVGPFTWSFESSRKTGEYSGVAYRLSTDGTWHRCQDTRVLEFGIRIPPSVSLSNLPEGTYSIEITNDQSEYWLLNEGLLQSGLDECAFKEYPGYGPISTDSFTIRAKGPESPPSPPSPPALESSPPASLPAIGSAPQVPPVSTTAPPKPLTRAQKLEKALRACTKKPKRERARCRAAAEKLYGPKRKAKGHS